MMTQIFVIVPIYAQYQNINFPFLSPYLSYISSGEKLLKYQEISSWVIIFSFLMAYLIDLALILQGEI